MNETLERVSESSAADPMATFEGALAYHRIGRLDEAAAIYRQLLQLNPDNALALNMLGNVEYQRDHVDDAIRLIGRAMAIDPRSSIYPLSLGHVHRRLKDLASAARCYRQALALAPGSRLAAMCLANALKGQGLLPEALEVTQGLLASEPAHLEALRLLGDLRLELGEPAEAGRAYLHFLAIEPASAEVLFGLGVASSQDGQPTLAVECFERALALKPDFAQALYNLGVMAVLALQFGAAEAWFRRALEADPDYVDARINLSAVLLKAGHAEEARMHRELAYRRQCLFSRTSRTALRTVLVLFDAGKGNLNLTHLFSRSRNNLIDWMIEYAAPGQSDALPPFDLVFNAMGDPDMIGAAALPAARFIAASSKPVLNLPEAVARTSREKIPALLAGIPGLFVPRVWRLAAGEAWPSEIAGRLPVLVRPVDSHGGEGLQLVTSADELAGIAARSSEPCYVSQFCDFRSADGYHRKYRIIFINRQPLPYHLAISPNWLVHYATADMADHPWKLAEERRFLENPEQVLGAAGFAANRRRRRADGSRLRRARLLRSCRWPHPRLRGQPGDAGPPRGRARRARLQERARHPHLRGLRRADVERCAIANAGWMTARAV